MRTATLIVIVSGFVTIGAYMVCQTRMDQEDRLLEQYAQPNPMAHVALEAQYRSEAETRADQN